MIHHYMAPMGVNVIAGAMFLLMKLKQRIWVIVNKGHVIHIAMSSTVGSTFNFI